MTDSITDKAKSLGQKAKSVSEKLGSKKPVANDEKQVRLRLVYVDFWSVTKMAFLASIAGAVILLVAVLMVWLVLFQTGIFQTLGDFLGSLLAEDQFNQVSAIGLPQVMLFAAAIALLNIVIGTALGAVGAALYNLAAKITGGIRLGFTNN
ncbi:MAG: DUF3566 domain-containing protein [Microbacteriaceae bacterium]